MDRFKDKITHQDKADLMAYAFRTDNLPQAMTVITGKGKMQTVEKQKKKEEMRTFFTTLLRSLYEAENECSKGVWRDIENYFSGITGLKITLLSENKQDYSHNIELCLCLWAIQHQKFTVAKGLFRQTKNIMVAALLAHKCLQKMKEDNTTAIHDLDKIESMAEYYNEIAKETLTACSRVKNESAKNVLVRKRDELGGMSLLQIAKYNMSFIAHDACHSKVNEIWFSPLEQLPTVQQKCLFLAIVVISYAVSSRAVLYPNSTFTWASLYTAFRKPYWHLFGELFLEEIDGDAECVAAGGMTNSTEFCPSTMAHYVMPVLLGVYMLIVHVLLMNLLIAKFSYTVTIVHAETDIYWRYLRFQLVYEYSSRTLIIPPISFIYHVYLLIQFCAKNMCMSLKEEVMNVLSRDYDSFCVTIP
ncbi:TRPCG-like protein [Mya arenaria]|uniref:TRPCG-like protein n=1 Tax=Mya arenaria TaxID=6604 RepID=A0ABY7F5J1_MYAAR|nr:TRPCG-like protein [Mya arenaria]